MSVLFLPDGDPAKQARTEASITPSLAEPFIPPTAGRSNFDIDQFATEQRLGTLAAGNIAETPVGVAHQQQVAATTAMVVRPPYDNDQAANNELLKARLIRELAEARARTAALAVELRQLRAERDRLLADQQAAERPEFVEQILRFWGRGFGL